MELASYPRRDGETQATDRGVIHLDDVIMVRSLVRHEMKAAAATAANLVRGVRRDRGCAD
jgi:hypothetical protein